MNRDEVQDDPGKACSTGLHVGTKSFAKDFGAVVIEVKIDPADVVSVPHESGGQKLRCAKYEVARVSVEDSYGLRHYEPAGTFTPEAAGESLVAAGVPVSFVSRLLSKVGIHRRTDDNGEL
jgi:hypothetical protein